MNRRRELCDAAIEVLGESGLKGLSHLQVDRRAGVAEGSTSVYFRTRSALLRATAERLLERAREGLIAATDPSRLDDAAACQRTPSVLASQLVTAATEPFRTQVKARYELSMEATRDPEMAALFQQNTDLELEFLRKVVLRLQPQSSEADEDILDDQTLAVVAMISGITLTLVAGDPSFRDPGKIDQFISAVVAGTRAVHDQEVRGPEDSAAGTLDPAAK